MVINNIANNVPKAGLCPHGLSPGACPICSGGGGGVMMDRNTRRRPYEMTWNECYAIGQMMKAELARRELAELQQQNAIMQNALMQNSRFQHLMSKLAETFSSIANFATNNIVTRTVSNMINTLNNRVFSPIVNTIANFVQKFAGMVKNVIADISDKLAAIFGEETLAKFKNIEKFIETGKKKIFALFGFVNKSQEENETSEIVKQEEKKVSVLEKLKRKLNLIKEENNENDN